MAGMLTKAAAARTVRHNQEGNRKVLVCLAAICCSVAGGVFMLVLFGEDTVLSRFHQQFNAQRVGLPHFFPAP